MEANQKRNLKAQAQARHQLSIQVLVLAGSGSDEGRQRAVPESQDPVLALAERVFEAGEILRWFKPTVPFWGFRCTTHFWSLFLWSGMFTGGTGFLTHGQMVSSQTKAGFGAWGGQNIGWGGWGDESRTGGNYSLRRRYSLW